MHLGDIDLSCVINSHQSTSSCSFCDVTDPGSVSEGLNPKSCGHSLTNKTEQPTQHKGEHAQDYGKINPTTTCN